jgi:hypothetical protein
VVSHDPLALYFPGNLKLLIRELASWTYQQFQKHTEGLGPLARPST